ncbi:hypothetical protein KAR91_67870 [Candidatus Pacearchaeota archaeon]|nr:hypothetical protein [Candidatus Pacearchaeota archaeon]
MMKQAEAAQVVEEEKVAEESGVVDERLEVLEKYAEAADGLMAEEYGTDYEEADVIKLANMMIQSDMEQEETLEKIAELEDQGTIMGMAAAEAFITRVNEATEEAPKEA